VSVEQGCILAVDRPPLAEIHLAESLFGRKQAKNLK
jgi:hypothetical protein